MGWLGQRVGERDVAIGVVLALALGLGLLFLQFFTAAATQATALLFGNVLGVDAGTIWTMAALAVVSVAALAAIARPLLFASLQPELAEARGCSDAAGLGVVPGALAGLAVSECVQVVGVLLVFALLVGPAAAAQRWSGRILPGIGLAVALALGQTWLRPGARLLDRLAGELLDQRAVGGGLSCIVLADRRTRGWGSR